MLACGLAVAATAPERCHQRERWSGLKYLDDGVAGTNTEGDEYPRWCLAVPGQPGDRACLAGPLHWHAGPAEGSAGGYRYELSYRRGTQVLHRQDVVSWPPGGREVLVLDRMAVQGLPEPATVVGVMQVEGNGLGASTWSVFAFDAAGQPRLSAEVGNYGELSGWFSTTGGKSCRLWAASWCHGSEPKHGPGMYVEGRWLQASLKSQNPPPTVRRRYRLGFEGERSSMAAPWPWFLHAGARQAPFPALPVHNPSYPVPACRASAATH